MKVKVMGLSCLLFLLVLSLKILYLAMPTGYDEGSYNSVGWLMNTRGMMLYNQGVNKPPLIFFIPFVLSYFTNGIWIFIFSRIFYYVCIAAFVSLLFLFVENKAGIRAGLFSSILFICADLLVTTGEYHVICLGAIFISIYLMSLIRILEGYREGWLYFSNALSLILALLTIQTSLLLIPITIGACFVYNKIPGLQAKYFIFAIFIVFIVMLPLLIQVNFNRIIEKLFIYNLETPKTDYSDLAPRLRLLLTNYNDNILLYSFAIMGLLIFRKFRDVQIIAVWAFVFLAFILLYNHIWPAYIIYLIIPLSILAGFGLDYFYAQIADKKAFIIVIGLIFLITAYSVINTIYLMLTTSVDNNEMAVAHYIRLRLNPDDGFLSVSADSYYLLTNRAPKQEYLNDDNMVVIDTLSYMTRLQKLEKYQNMTIFEMVANGSKMVYFDRRSGQIDRNETFYDILYDLGFKRDYDFERIYPYSGIIMVK